MSGTVKKNKGGKKGRKYGRNVDYCATYKACNLELKNKIRKVRRHLRQKRHLNDKQNRARYLELSGKQI